MFGKKKKKKVDILLIGDDHLNKYENEYSLTSFLLPARKLKKEKQSALKDLEARQEALPFLKGEEKKQVKKEIEGLQTNLNFFSFFYESAPSFKKFRKKGYGLAKSDANLDNYPTLDQMKRVTKKAKEKERAYRNRKNELNTAKLIAFDLRGKPDAYLSEYEHDDYLEMLGKKAKKEGVPVIMIDSKSLYDEELNLLSRQQKLLQKIEKASSEKEQEPLLDEYYKLFDQVELLNDMRTKAMAENIKKQIEEKGYKKVVVLVGQGHIFLKGGSEVRLNSLLKREIPNAKIKVLHVGEQKAINKLFRPITYFQEKAEKFIERERFKKIAEKAKKQEAKKEKERINLLKKKKRRR